MEEAFTKEQDANGYWRLGYSAVMSMGREIHVGLGSSYLAGRSMIVHSPQEARDYIRAIDTGLRAVEWNSSAPKHILPREEVLERIKNLVDWCTAGTSALKLSHHGIRMDAPILSNGQVIVLAYSGMTNCFYAYEGEFQCQQVDAWALPPPGNYARELLEEAGLGIVDSWNDNRSMIVNIFRHDSVRAAFKPSREGCPKKDAKELPDGWIR